MLAISFLFFKAPSTRMVELRVHAKPKKMVSSSLDVVPEELRGSDSEAAKRDCVKKWSKGLHLRVAAPRPQKRARVTWVKVCNVGFDSEFRSKVQV